MVWVMCLRTSSPVRANTTVTATEVESRILDSSDSLKNGRRILFRRSRIGSGVRYRRVWHAVFVQMRGLDEASLRDGNQGQRETFFGNGNAMLLEESQIGGKSAFV